MMKLLILILTCLFLLPGILMYTTQLKREEEKEEEEEDADDVEEAE